MKRLLCFFRERSLFLRYLGGLMGLAFVILMLLSGALFHISQRTLHKQLDTVEAHYLSSVGESITSQLQLARQTAGSLTTNEFVKQTIFRGSSEWSEVLYDASLAVKQGLSSNACIAGICLISDEQILIKSERNYQEPSYDQQMIDMMVWHSHEAMAPWRMNSSRKNCQYVSIIQPAGALQPPNHTGGVLVTLDMDRVAQQVFAGSTGLFYALDKQGRVILSNDSTAFLCTGSELPVLAQAAQGAREAEANGDNYVISNASFETFTLYHLTPRRLFYGSLQQYATLALLILLACAALAIPLSLLLARRAYRPVKNVFIQLASRMDETTGEPVSELQAASNAIVHIYETIDAYRSDMEASALRACLVNAMPRDSDGEQLRKTLGDLPYHRLVVVGVPEDDALVQRATDIASSYLSGHYHTTSVSTGENTITLVLSDKQPIEESALRSLLSEAVLSLNQLVSRTALFAIGPGTIDVAGLHEAYTVALKRMATSALYTASGCICAVQDDPPETPLADELCAYASHQDHEAFLEGLEQMFLACQPCPMEMVFERLALLSVRIRQPQSILPLRSTDALSLFGSDYRRLRTLRSHTALIAHFMDLFRAAAGQSEKAQENENKRLTELSLAYIAQHFSQRTLSAQEVADMLHISVSHFSRVLKKNTGKTFLEIVTACRMEKAAQLLAEPTQLSITAFSQACGFTSPSYFTASFKKWFGVTPSEYRMRLAAEEREAPKLPME